MHVPSCHYRGYARKVGYKMAERAMFMVSFLDTLKG